MVWSQDDIILKLLFLARNNIVPIQSGQFPGMEIFAMLQPCGGFFVVDLETKGPRQSGQLTPPTGCWVVRQSGQPTPLLVESVSNFFEQPIPLLG